MRTLLALTAIALVAACAAPQRGPSNQVINRILKSAPGEAQPSTIVATELAFARMARDDGQWTAFREFAAPGAMLHGRNGAVPAAEFLANLPDPEVSVQWSPRTVVMSCDGSMAASLGRFRDPDGKVGRYVTVWQRNSDNEYRWVYDAGALDDPQPPAPELPGENDIVVTAIDAVQGLIADCPYRGAVPPPPSGFENQGGGTSRDGTFRWRWLHHGDDVKYIAVDYFFEGKWQTPLEESLTSPTEE